jgi:hypothetical protein
MAKQLRPHNVAAVSIWMGGLDTERARAYLASLPEAQRSSQKRESPRFTGRIIAALYASESMMDLSGRALIGAELGMTLRVTDVDGNQPLSHRYMMGGPPRVASIAHRVSVARSVSDTPVARQAEYGRRIRKKRPAGVLIRPCTTVLTAPANPRKVSDLWPTTPAEARPS